MVTVCFAEHTRTGAGPSWQRERDHVVARLRAEPGVSAGGDHDELPAGGHATPMTYRSPSGRQLGVIAAGGHTGLRTKTGDHVVAFALP